MKKIVQKKFESKILFTNSLQLSPEAKGANPPTCATIQQPTSESSFTRITESLSQIIPALQQDVLAELNIRIPQKFSELPLAKSAEKSAKSIGYPHSKNADEMLKGGITASVENAIKSLEEALTWLT